MSDQLVKFVFEDQTKQGGGSATAAPGPVPGGRAARQQEEVSRSRSERTSAPARQGSAAAGGSAEKTRVERAMQDAQSVKAVRLAAESFGKLWARLSDAVQARLIRKADDYARQFGLDKFFGSLAKRFKDYFDALGNPNGPRGSARAAGGRTTVVDSFVKGFKKAAGGEYSTETKSPRRAGGGKAKGSSGGSRGGLSQSEIDQLRELGGDDLVQKAMDALKGGKPAPGGAAASTSRGLIIDSEFVGAGTAAGGRAAGTAMIPTGAAAGGSAAAAGGTSIATTGGGLAAAGGAGGGVTAAGGGAAAGGAALASNPVGWAILAALAVVVVTIGAAIVAVKALTTINTALKARFGEVSERLKPFSAGIQAADARAGVAKLRQDVEFAGRLGGRVGRFNEAENRIERALDRIGNTINGPLLNIVLPFVERAAGLIEGGAKAFDAITTIADKVGLLRSPLAELIDIENKILGFSKDEAMKLPPEADVIGVFNAEPFLSVNWRGRTFGADEGRELGAADKKTYASPLPVVGIP